MLVGMTCQLFESSAPRPAGDSSSHWGKSLRHVIVYVGSRVAAGLLVACGCIGCYLLFKNKGLLYQRCRALGVGGRSLVRQTELSDDTSASDFANRSGTSHKPPTKRGSNEGYELDAADDLENDDTWAIVFQLGGRDHESPPLPMRYASNIDELKEAVALLAYESLGARATPPDWVDGNFDSMRVQYLTSQVILVSACLPFIDYF